MNKISKQSLKHYMLCTFVIILAESGISWILDYFFYSMYEGGNGREYTHWMILNLGTSFLFLFVGAYIFYRFSKKVIKAESKRQVQEQNLLYSSIAHDLKTPITSIQGFATALKEGKIKTEEQEEILDIIYRKSRHMNELIETLLAYSKLGTESYALNWNKTNICSLVRDMLAMNYSEFEEKEMELDIEIPDEPIFCNIDEKEFRRAMNNLIVNAYKHNKRRARILIQVYREKECAFITVGDDGKVIPKELAENMFKPFVSGDASRTSGSGNGLGLAISSTIVEKHGGKLYMKDCGGGYTKKFVVQIQSMS